MLIGLVPGLGITPRQLRVVNVPSQEFVLTYCTLNQLLCFTFGSGRLLRCFLRARGYAVMSMSRLGASA